MKKLLSFIIIAVLSLTLVSGVVYAKVVVKKGPQHKTVIVKKGLKTVVIKKDPNQGVVVLKKVRYPRRTVVIASRPLNYRPWRFIGRIEVIAPAVVYAYPHPGSVVIVNASEGAEYQVIEEYNGWYRVKFEGKDGWVQKDKVDVTEVQEEVETEGNK